MPHQVEPCRGSVANLVVAVVLGEAVRGHDTAVHPSALCKVAVEDVVEVQAEDDLHFLFVSKYISTKILILQLLQ